MIRAALRSLSQHKLRTTLTALAILLGVAMISGTYVLTDQIRNGFDDIFQTAYQKISVTVSPKSSFDAVDATSAAATMPETTLAAVRRVPGVAAADGNVSNLTAVFVHGRQVKSGGAPTIVESAGDPRFQTGSWVSGHAPAAAGEVAVTAGFANKQQLGVGDSFALLTREGQQTVRISGVYSWPAEASMGGTIVVDARLADVQRWFGLQGKLNTINVAAEPGVSAAELRDRLRAALPADVDVKTGEQAAADQSSSTSQAINSFLRPALLAFGGVAVFVGAFIIFNAFSITVAQRRREFALLRALGASRRQVLTTVAAEALAMGITASLLGLFAGLGVAKAINALFKALGADIPASGVALAPRTVLVALLIGVGVTLASALVPALRATRVPPLAAISEGAALPPSRLSRLSTPAAAGFALLGAGALAAGMLSSASTTIRLLEMGLGALLLFVSLAMLAKFVVRPLAAVIGRPLQALAPGSGRLARENATRDPRRTASTAAALMIGLALVVLVAVFAQGLKTSFVDALARSNRAAIVVSDDSSMMALPPAAVAAVRSLPDVSTATGIAFAPLKLQDGVTTVNAVESGRFADVWQLTWLAGGDQALLRDLAPGEAIVEEDYAKSHNLTVGSTITATAQSGRTLTLAVVGEHRDPLIMGGVTVSTETFRRLGLPADPSIFLAAAHPGVSPETLKAEVSAALTDFPTQTVRTEADYDAYMVKQVNQILLMLYALLAMSVTISVFGIVNTLVLSVYERTREIGMLRAIGASRRQVRRMVRYESVITSVIGGVLGIVVGVVLGYLLVTQLGGPGLTFAVPGVQLALFLAASVAVGVLAAVLPARRAAAVDILAAIHHE